MALAAAAVFGGVQFVTNNGASTSPLPASVTETNAVDTTGLGAALSGQ